MDQGLYNILTTAVDLPAGERDEYLTRACGGDQDLRARVDALLALEAEAEARFPDADHGVAAGMPEAVPGPSPGAGATVSAERYVPDHEIGRGGMGIVLHVRDTWLERDLAMKILRPAGVDPPADGSPSPQRVHRFLREARITAQLDHPGILPVHDIGLDAAKRPHYTMRLVHGKSLAAIFALARSRADGWSLSRAVGVLIKVCQTVAFAHSRGVIHRDLKPENIMVGAFGEVYVMDWGLARRKTTAAPGSPAEAQSSTGALAPQQAAPALDPDDSADALLTRQGALLGTLPFMSPEQACGDLARVDELSDLYSLGAILHTLLAGAEPYAGESPLRAHEKLLRGERTPLATLAPTSPPELVAICEKAMAREKSDRYRSCLLLAEDLQAFIDRRVVRAYRSGPLVELRKWVERNRALAVAITAAVFLATVGLASALWIQRQANVDLTEAKSEVETSLKKESQARQETAQLLEESQRLLARHFADMGRNAFADRAFAAAAMYFAKSLELAENSTTRGLLHRARSNGFFAPCWTAPAGFGATRALRLSPDGKLLVTGSHDGIIRLWETKTLKLLREIPGHHGAIVAVAFHPGGAILATASLDRTVRTWKLADGTRAAQLEADAGEVRCVAFSPNGEVLASGHEDGTLALWATATWTRREGPPRAPAGIRAVALGPGGKWIAIGDASGSVKVLDASTGISLGATKSLEAPVAAIAVTAATATTPSAGLLAAAWSNGQVGLLEGGSWRILTGADVTAGPIHGLAFDRSGRLLAAAGAHGTALLDPLSGRLERLIKEPAGEVLAMALGATDADSADPSLLATSSSDRTVRLWNARSGELTAVGGGHEGEVHAVAWIPRTDRVVAAATSGSARVWDVVAGREILRLERPGANSPGRAPSAPARCIATSPDGRHIAAGHDDGSLVLWEAETGALVWQKQKPTGRISALAFATNETLVAASHDVRVRLWSVAGAVLEVLEPAQPVADKDRGEWGLCRLLSLAVGSGGGLMAAGGLDGVVSVWEKTGPVLTTLRASSPVNCLAFTPDGKYLLAGCANGAMRFWRLHDGLDLWPGGGTEHEVRSLAITADGKLLASTSDDGTLRLWRLDDLGAHCDVVPIATYAAGSMRFPAIAFAVDGRLAAGRSDGTFSLWESPRSIGQERYNFLDPQIGEKARFSLSADGSLMAVAAGDVRLKDPHRRTDVEVLTEELADFDAVSLAPSGRWLAAGTPHGKLGLWEVASGGCRLLVRRKLHDRAITGLVFHEGERLLFATASDGTIRTVSIERGEETAPAVDLKDGIHCAAASRDGRWLALGTQRGDIHVWEAPPPEAWPLPASAGKARRVLRGHTGAVKDLAYQPATDLLASGGEDRTIRIWDLARGQLVRRLDGHDQSITALCFHPHGLTLVSGSSDKTLRFWNLSRGTELARTGLGRAVMVTDMEILPEADWLLLTTNEWRASAYPLAGLFDSTEGLAERLTVQTGLEVQGRTVAPALTNHFVRLQASPEAR